MERDRADRRFEELDQEEQADISSATACGFEELADGETETSVAAESPGLHSPLAREVSFHLPDARHRWFLLRGQPLAWGLCASFAALVVLLGFFGQGQYFVRSQTTAVASQDEAALDSRSVDILPEVSTHARGHDSRSRAETGLNVKGSSSESLREDDVIDDVLGSDGLHIELQPSDWPDEKESAVDLSDLTGQGSHGSTTAGVDSQMFDVAPTNSGRKIERQEPSNDSQDSAEEPSLPAEQGGTAAEISIIHVPSTNTSKHAEDAFHVAKMPRRKPTGHVVKWQKDETSKAHDDMCAPYGISGLRFRAMSTGFILRVSPSQPLFIPMLTSTPLHGRDKPHVKQVVIVMHGHSRAVDRYFCQALAAARRASKAEDTVILAPYFTRVQRHGRVVGTGKSAQSLFWEGPMFYGQGSSNWQSVRSSSFAVLDYILRRLRREKERGILRGLSSIKLVGFSAGCQLVSRWAVFSPVPKALTAAGIPLQIVIGSCGSYPYLDHYRPAKHCRRLENTRVPHRCQKFLPGKFKQCKSFNSYRWGLDFDDSHRDLKYLTPFVKSKRRKNKAIRRFAAVDLRLLLHVKDNCNCMPAFSNTEPHCIGSLQLCKAQSGGQSSCCDSFPAKRNILDTSCEAMAGGSNRLQRGLNWAGHLRDFFARKRINFSIQVEFNTGSFAHSFGDMASSPVFHEWVFATNL
eukprot:TRINITY_DN17072_c0_g1_i2.p1 TRINITY_DN17072_c0_g1~~TRINITY_DN17072_c0_g1_i2.p1  ORF type:complete len:690 (+),score=93.42 TRINITY_DN17072_c0_g1_i2:37-2106(+)